MTELTPGTKIKLTAGGQVSIVKELGRGGQGIVYLVDLNGESKALKWYLNAPNEAFYKNLQQNIINGAPSDAFLWPEYLTERQQGSYGYVMRLRPKNYFEFGNFLLAKKSFKSYTAMLAAAMKICHGFMMLHRFGYSYQDLNDGNFFIDPTTGDVLICDNDNVMPQGEKSGIMGKARYMAPEIVAGGIPDKYSDRFSLTVILFMLFYANHPLEGAKVVACPCMTESYEKKFYGSEATFIYDPNDNSNRPVRGIHTNVIRRWPAFPAKLRETFITELSQECLKNPQKRLIESQWEKVISGIRDELIRCPYCGEETFAESEPTAKCMECGKDIDVSHQLLLGTRHLVLTKGTEVYIDYDNTPDCQVVEHPQDPTRLLLKNISPVKWTAETPSGKLKEVEPGGLMPINPGIKVAFLPNYKGEIIQK
jgi:serine/threonine protein kinase